MLSTFAVSPDASLEHLADTPVGRSPRHFAVLEIAGESDMVAVANQEDSTLTSLRIDPVTGRGSEVGSVPLPAPACVLPAD